MSLALALLLVQAGAVATDDPLAGIPDVVVTYYDVEGRTPAAIRASMNARRPTDPNDGKRVDALARWRIGTRWRTNGTACVPASAEARFSGTLLFPRLVDPAVPAGLRARWDRSMAALLRHEAGHLRHPYDRLGTVVAAMRGAADCAGMTAARDAAIAELARHDITYDAETDHGRRTGVSFP